MSSKGWHRVVKAGTPLLLVGLVLGPAACGLVSRSCTLIGCLEGAGVTVTSGSGAPVASLEITVSVAGTEVSTTCPPPTQSSPFPAAAIDGVTVSLMCGEGTSFFIDNASRFRDSLRLRLLASSGESYDGAPDVKWTEREINGEGCGTCTSGATTVVLH